MIRSVKMCTMSEIKDVYRYCPRCAGKFNTKKDYLVCEQCSLQHYFNPKPATAALLVSQDGEYLLVKRAVEPKKGWWDLPGGFVEGMETFEDCTSREINEELGLEIAKWQYVGSYPDFYDYQGIVYNTLVVTFTAEIINHDQIKPADDVSGYAFFKLEDVPTEKFAFPAMTKIFEKLKN